MKTRSIYRGYRFPPDIIAHAAWLYHRFALGLRDVEDLLAERGIEVSYETIRQWCARFGPQFSWRIKRGLGRRGGPHLSMHADSFELENRDATPE